MCLVHPSSHLNVHWDTEVLFIKVNFWPSTENCNSFWPCYNKYIIYHKYSTKHNFSEVSWRGSYLLCICSCHFLIFKYPEVLLFFQNRKGASVFIAESKSMLNNYKWKNHLKQSNIYFYALSQKVKSKIGKINTNTNCFAIFRFLWASFSFYGWLKNSSNDRGAGGQQIPQHHTAMCGSGELPCYQAPLCTNTMKFLRAHSITGI